MDNEFFHMQNMLHSQLNKEDEFYQSRRGSNMTKKLNSSSGGDDFDQQAPIFATIGGQKLISHK